MLNNYIQRAGTANNHQIYQTKCSDHHKSCLEVSPPKHNLPAKFSSRPNLTFRDYPDCSGQCNTMTSYSYQINRFKPITVGGSISSLPNDIPTNNIPDNHHRTNISSAAQEIPIRRTDPPNYNELRFSHGREPVIDGKILSSDDNITYSNGPSNIKLVEPTSKQLMCQQSCTHELALNLGHSQHYDMVAEMITPERSKSEDCPDVPQFTQQTDVNYDETNNQSMIEFHNNLQSEAIENQTMSSLQKFQSSPPKSSQQPDLQESLNNSETRVSPSKEELDHELILQTMDRLYKRGSSHSVEV